MPDLGAFEGWVTLRRRVKVKALGGCWGLLLFVVCTLLCLLAVVLFLFGVFWGCLCCCFFAGCSWCFCSYWCGSPAIQKGRWIGSWFSQAKWTAKWLGLSFRSFGRKKTTQEKLYDAMSQKLSTSLYSPLACEKFKPVAPHSPGGC